VAVGEEAKLQVTEAVARAGVALPLGGVVSAAKESRDCGGVPTTQKEATEAVDAVSEMHAEPEEPPPLARGRAQA